MRYFLVFTSLLFSFLQSHGQKINVAGYYSLDVPFKNVMPNMSANHSFGLHVGYKLSKMPLWINGDFSTGRYAMQTREDVYFFLNGVPTITDVNYVSNLSKYLIGINYDIGKMEKLISSYLILQGGYAYMNSRVIVDDPTDIDGCRPLDNRNAYGDGGFIYSAGAGARVHLGMKKQHYRKNYIDISCQYTGGGNFSYINTKHMTDHMPSTNAKDFNVKFINLATNQIHEHKVAEIYSSPFRMLNFKVGYSIFF